MSSKDGRIFLDRQELAGFCRENRENGATIGFTNGVFDLIHVGHLDSLHRAKAEADILVVGLNSDESVQRLKGSGRPLLPLEQRLRILAAFEVVDAVAPFEEDTPAALIETVEPDVLIKGGHYQVHEIVGHEFVQARGGRVLSLPLVPGHSSTDIVEAIKSRFLN